MRGNSIVERNLNFS